MRLKQRGPNIPVILLKGAVLKLDKGLLNVNIVNKRLFLNLNFSLVLSHSFCKKNRTYQALGTTRKNVLLSSGEITGQPMKLFLSVSSHILAKKGHRWSGFKIRLFTLFASYPI